MRYVYILCQKYLDSELSSYSIGGIETYIFNLAKVIQELNLIPVVIQYANSNKSTQIDDVKVIGVDVTNLKHLRHMNERLHKCFLAEYQNRPGLLVYATEGLISNRIKKNIYSIAIQHGISWDKPDYSKKGNVKYELDYWFQALLHRYTLRKVECVNQLICVDYNYVNWYRALVAYSKIRLSVIPNFTRLPEMQSEGNNEKIKIIFARRFVEYRGTRIFATAIKKLLAEYGDIEVTLAGDGPDEIWLRSFLPENERVHYIKYQSHESLKIHSDKDIAVIPTIGSEGTSLSLLEAMASHCAVISSNVGGMTNIVIDGYNGVVIEPNSESLYIALKKLINDEILRKSLADRAYETVEKGFSYDVWKKKWMEVLTTVPKEAHAEK